MCVCDSVSLLRQIKNDDDDRRRTRTRSFGCFKVEKLCEKPIQEGDAVSFAFLGFCVFRRNMKSSGRQCGGTLHTRLDLSASADTGFRRLDPTAFFGVSVRNVRLCFMSLAILLYRIFNSFLLYMFFHILSFGRYIYYRRYLSLVPEPRSRQDTYLFECKPPEAIF